MGTRNLFDSAQWIAWIGATGTACLLLSNFAFTHFESRADAQQKRADDRASLLEIKETMKDLTDSVHRIEQKVNYFDGKLQRDRRDR